MTTLTVRIDEDTKSRASEIAREFGLDLSTAIRCFCKQIVRERAIPLSFSHEEPNEESLAAIRETEEMMRSGSAPRYESAAAMFAAIDAEVDE